MKLGSQFACLGLVVAALATLPATQAAATTVQINPSKDNTLYQTLDGSLSNGVGWYIFAGETAVGEFRRALLEFDVAGNIPPGSVINSATLTLNVSKEPLGNALTHDFFLHRATADWGESTSDAFGEEGSGGPSATGDATWIHREYDTVDWTTAGGDFDASVSATTGIPPGLGLAMWSDAGMVSDVQGWLDAPASNFGWILVGDETQTASARRFDSKDLGGPGAIPVLEIDFTPPAPSVTPWGLLALMMLLTAVGGVYLARRRAASLVA